MRVKIALLSLVISFGIALSLGAQTSVTKPKYTVRVIDSLPGSAYDASIQGFNNMGQILIRGKKTTYLCTDQKSVDIGNLGPIRPGALLETGPGAIGTMLNDRGQVVGFCPSSDGKVHAFLWESGKMTDLGTLGGARSRAFGINNKGQVVGAAEDAKGMRRAFIWEKGKGMRSLGIAGTDSQAFMISDRGQVLGLQGRDTYFLWQDGAYKTLQNMPVSKQLYISPNGEIAGVNPSQGIFMQQKNAWVKIPTPQFDSSAKITSFPKPGFVVGCGTYDYNITAFVWKQGNFWTPKELLPRESGWDLTASLIYANAKEQLALHALQNGELRIILLTPK